MNELRAHEAAVVASRVLEKSVRFMRQELSANSPVIEQRAGQSRLLSRLYRDVGLAAIVAELELNPDALEPETAEAVDRGLTVLLASRGAILAA
jgi:hypothetical protein